MNEKVIVDWQAGLKVMERMEHLLKNPDLLGDITFQVKRQPEKEKKMEDKSTPDDPTSIFKAHRFILAMGSSVFHTMFFGSLPPKPDEVIEMDDVLPEAFTHLLRFLYTDTFSTAINKGNALDLVYAAKKYGVDRLVLMCEDLLVKEVTQSEATYFCMKAAFFELRRLEQRCWELIDRGAKEILHSEEILQVDEPMMGKIVKRKSLRVREVHVFQAAERWANQHGKLNVLRQWLKDDWISIEAMSKEEILKVCDGLVTVGSQLEDLLGNNIYRILYQHPTDFTTANHRRVAPGVNFMLPSTVKMERPASIVRRHGKWVCCCHQNFKFLPRGSAVYFVGCTLNVAGKDGDDTAYVVTFLLWNRSTNVVSEPESVAVSNLKSKNGEMKVLLKRPLLCLGTDSGSEGYILIIQMSKRPSKVYELNSAEMKEDWCRIEMRECPTVEYSLSVLCPASALEIKKDTYLYNEFKLSHTYGFVTGLHFEDT